MNRQGFGHSDTFYYLIKNIDASFFSLSLILFIFTFILLPLENALSNHIVVSVTTMVHDPPTVVIPGTDTTLSLYAGWTRNHSPCRYASVLGGMSDQIPSVSMPDGHSFMR
ncbi:hypothetical protein [Enterobacter cloacae]|uniref:hypothetical protein n=1 Tax=Enterobacter cloacae TaxID=550 RepID=UPI00101B1AC5|nr:hypothetical protein [Enterobacter cloacae]QBC03327.1 hypothetical protein EWI30_15085 [Enterobacter cloacae]